MFEDEGISMKAVSTEPTQTNFEFMHSTYTVDSYTTPKWNMFRTKHVPIFHSNPDDLLLSMQVGWTEYRPD